MRNKKLISMLMLSAGFVACTQDEIVENGFAGIENQRVLVEDVTLNVFLGENALTRGAYAGDGAGEVFQQFYLEPEVGADGEFVLSNNSALAGDMIGFCLSDGARFITNYPFYIAGYGSAVAAADKQEEGYLNSVYSLSDGTGLYDLGIDANTQKYVTATPSSVTTSVKAIKDLKANANGEYPELDADVMDVRKGIVRTHAGVMTGDYIAYYPYNSKFVDPAGIPATGEKALTDLYNVKSLADDRATALSNVGFYDYLFAISRMTNEVSGASKSGDVSIVPMTSALTFKLTNSALADAEKDIDGQSEEIKRITVRSKNGEAAFILEGTVEYGNLNAVKYTKTTDLIGASFTAEPLGAATEATDEDGNKSVVPNVKYVTIPYMAVSGVNDYVVEIYNTNGQVATIEQTGKPLGLGEAKIMPIEMSTLKFENATRKIFTVEDFLAEVPAGGKLQLMTDISITELPEDGLTIGTGEEDDKTPAIEIIGNKNLELHVGTYNVDIVKEEGYLYIGSAAVVNKNVTADVLTIQQNVIEGDVTATTMLKVNSDWGQDLDLTSVKINAKKISLGTTGSGVITLVDVTADDVYVGSSTNVCFNRKSVKVDNVNKWVEPSITNLEVVNGGTVEVKYLNVENVKFSGALNVTGTLNADKVDSDVLEYGTSYRYGTMTVAGSVKQGLVYTDDHFATLNWNSTSDMNMVVNLNKGTMNIGKENASEVTECNLTGSINNKATLNVYKRISLVSEGSITTTGTVNVAQNIGIINGSFNVNAGTVVVAADATLSGNSNSLVVASGAEIIKVAKDFVNEITGSTKFNQKFTAIRVNSTIPAASAFTTDKKLYLATGCSLTLAEGTALADVVVEGAATLTAKKASAASIDIYSTGNLTLGAGSYINVSGDVVNEGTYNGVGSTVDCNNFSGDGEWTNNVTPNC